ncbi:hypothetical protein KKC88_02170 [Patescibacteria group bacterium]|nr:hypothetical protein [Patescibacteria group bacterium]MBU1673113.1 hypothetical protein [Patescibacteria group bacterium]MBU1963791.1 hypothetical protein [Patescibacteria group bacterium]
MGKKSCQNCNKTFPVHDRDVEFYKRIDVPEPTWCPDCRQQRRLSFRNLKNLYLRKCDFSGKQIVSNYSPDNPFKVYKPDIFWSDKWDALEYGQDYDFNCEFFEQYKDLQKQVPRLSLYNKGCENSDFTNHSTYNKNCYLCFNLAYSENCLYTSNFVIYSKDCVDCYDMQKSELLYECFRIRECYNSEYLFHCTKCFDSSFLYDCNGCNNCFMCYNLRNQEYCIFNKKYSKQEYQEKLEKLKPHSYEDWQKKRQEFLDLIANKAIHKYARIEKSENCTGDQLGNDRNVIDSYAGFESENSRYCYDFGEIKDCCDAYETWRAELLYETHAFNESQRLIGCSIGVGLTDSAYCEFCYNSKNLFGCISLHKKENCILNKQYSENDYKRLKEKIIAHMKKTGEWGEFFPMDLSPFAYNETVAQEYYPLDKDRVKALRLEWKKPEDKVDDPQAKKCSSCNRSFKIVPQEAEFYKNKKLPEPEKCFDCRYNDRISLRDARHIWKRQCMCTQPDHGHQGRCPNEFETTYSPERKELVYCEECYNKEIY